jgi:adenylylsulfate kinase
VAVGISTHIFWQETMVSKGDKEVLLGQRRCVLWFTDEPC